MDPGAIAFIAIQVIRMIVEDVEAMNRGELTPEEALARWEDQAARVKATADRWRKARRRDE